MMITKSELQPRADLYSLLSRLYRVEVDASLLDKLKTRIPKPDNRVSAADLQKRLSRLPH